MSGKTLPAHTPSAKRKTLSGFTLIELSIVLVIIGLIVGGVLVGRELINTAKLRKVVSEVDKFTTAIQTFRVKYGCTPGDCKNATTFFTGTHNGNDDGKINVAQDPWSADENHLGIVRPNNNSVAGIPEEVFLLNEHLAYAGLIALAPFDHTGTPPVPMRNKWYVNLGNPDWNLLALTDGYGRNVIRIGAWQNTDSGWEAFIYIGGGGNTKMYWPDEAFYIDSKTDDGLPLTGAVIDDLNVGAYRSDGGPSYFGCELNDDANGHWYQNAYNIPRTSNGVLGGAPIVPAACALSFYGRF